MSNAEERIARMKFDNSQFERGVKQSLLSLQRLKDSLKSGFSKIPTPNLSGIASGFSKLKSFFGFSKEKQSIQDLQNQANRFNLNSMANSTAGIGRRFTAMSTVAIAAIATIASKATSAGLNIAKSLSISPVLDGFKEYETNMNSIQTILSNTKDKGSTLKDVRNALDELNHYSDKTIYNFSEMARNIGTFTAAGVDLKTSVSSIKGIANLAAISGSNSQQASTAMYQLSQAIAAGKVNLQDWNSVVNAGMGGSIFQKALVRTAQNMGTVDKGSVKLEGRLKKLTINGESFRESIQSKPGEKPWLTSEVLTNTLSQLSGNLTDAQLKAQGFTDSQIKDIQALAKNGVDAATKVKTLTQLMGTLREAVGSGWAKSFQLLFGDFGEAKRLFTGLSNYFGGMIQKGADARNKLLAGFAKLGGRKALLGGLENGFKAFLSVIRPIKAAFRDIFPPKTAQDLTNMAKSFEAFTKRLILGKGTAENLRSTFRGFFALIDIGVQIVKGFLGMLGNLFGVVGQGSGGFLNFTGSVGDFIVSIDEAIKKGGLLTGFFKGLGSILAVPIRILGNIGAAFARLFGIDTSGSAKLSDALDRVDAGMNKVSKTGKKFSAFWEGVKDFFAGIGDFFAPILDGIGNFFSGLGDAIAGALKKSGFDPVFEAINTGLIGGILLILKKALGGGGEINFSLFGDAFKGISAALGELANTFQLMQKQIRANIMIKIAGAIAILAGALFILSRIPAKDLTKALAGVAVGFGGLELAIAGLAGLTSFTGAAKLPFIVSSMVGLASALVVFAGAMKIMSTLSWNEIAKGLVGVGGGLAILTGAVIVLAKYPGATIRAAASMTVMATALVILAGAVKRFGSLDLKTIGKGLGAMTAALVIMIAAVSKMPAENIVRISGSLILLGTALNIIASALKSFGSLSLEQIAKGVVSMAASLGILVVAVSLMPPNLGATGAGLVLLGIGLNAIAKAVASFGGLSLKEIAKGLTAMAAALTIINVAMGKVPKDLGKKAAAMVAVSVALNLIARAVVKMGGMSWGEIARGLVALGGALAILAAGLYAMTGSLSGAAALAVAAGAINLLVPPLIALGLLSWETIIKSLLALAGALAVIGGAALLLSPTIPALLGLGAALLLIGGAVALAGAGVAALGAGLGAIAAAGVGAGAALGHLLGVLGKSLGPLLEGLAKGLLRMVQYIAEHAGEFATAMGKMIGSGIDQAIKLAPKFGKLMNTLTDVGIRVVLRNVPKFAEAGLKLIIALIGAAARNVGKIVKVATDFILNFLRAIRKNDDRVADAGAKTVISLIHAVAGAIRRNSREMGKAGADLASAIIRGMIDGLTGGHASEVINAAKNVAKSALNAAKNFLGINSPSKEFTWIGEMSDRGLAKGFDDHADKVERSARGVAENAFAAVQQSLANMTQIDGLDINPTITPVLDLTQLTKDANSITGLLPAADLNARLYNRGRDISTGFEEMRNARLSTDNTPTVVNNKFEQNNYSPTALSAGTIYKNTRTQFSLAKGALE